MTLLPKAAERLPAFTRLDLVAVVALLAMLGIVSLRAGFTSERRDRQAVCVNNLSRIGQSFNSWATDHQDLYPFQVPVPQGGTRGSFVELADQFTILSNHLGQTRFLVCPTDPVKSVAFHFSSLRSAHISYFLSHPFVAQGRSILAGDRNLPWSSSSLSCSYLSGTLSLSLPAAEGAGWDGQCHGLRGNLLFNDGSVEQKDNAGLRNRLTSSTDSVASFHYCPPR